MSKPYAFLNFPVPQLRDDFKLPSGTSQDNVIFYRTEELNTIFTEAFLALLRQTGVEPHSVLVFHQMPFVQRQRIHIDNLQSKTSTVTFALNWIFGEGPMATRWFSPRQVDGQTYEGFKVVNNKHQRVVDGKPQEASGYTVTQFDPQHLDLYCETDDKGPLLVYSSLPHHGVNLGETERWSVSLRVTHDIPTPEALFETFKEWTVDDRTLT
jgi:hypothetical protein